MSENFSNLRSYKWTSRIRKSQKEIDIRTHHHIVEKAKAKRKFWKQQGKSDFAYKTTPMRSSVDFKKRKFTEENGMIHSKCWMTEERKKPANQKYYIW